MKHLLSLVLCTILASSAFCQREPFTIKTNAVKIITQDGEGKTKPVDNAFFINFNDHLDVLWVPQNGDPEVFTRTTYKANHTLKSGKKYQSIRIKDEKGNRMEFCLMEDEAEGVFLIIDGVKEGDYTIFHFFNSAEYPENK